MSGGGKRPRYDDEGCQIKQLELELELARLRREESAMRQANDSSIADQEGEPGPSNRAANETPVATPRSASAPPAAATSTLTPKPRQQLPLPGLASVPNQQVNRGRGRGRGVARGGRVQREFGTVFVYVTHDDLFCKSCN